MANIADFRCAVADSPEVTLAAAATVALSPDNNTVNTNKVKITRTAGGPITINSFGIAFDTGAGVPSLDAVGNRHTITKKVTFAPTVGNPITLNHNPPALTLPGNADRIISTTCTGTYISDTNGNWLEESYLNKTNDPLESQGLKLRVESLEDRATALEGRSTALEGRATAVEGRSTTLEGRADAMDTRVDALEDRVDALELAISTDLADLTTTTGTIGADVAALQADVTTLQGQMSALTAVVAAIHSRLSIVEAS